MRENLKQAKWRGIFEDLQRNLRMGNYPAGVSLPSEEALIRRYGVSRITAVRAMEELVRRGLVYRRRGAGTFATKVATRESGRLGLIIPSLSFGEIFPLICQNVTRLAQNDGYSIILGDVSSPTPQLRAQEACEVARAFVEQRIAGVILQPLAFLRSQEKVTKSILSLFREANIPVVLLDRDIAVQDIAYDFVGIDNLNAGRALGAHMLARGARRVHFLMRPNCASIIRTRLDGVQSALGDHRCGNNVIVAEPSDVRALAAWFKRRARPDAVICESDYVAAMLRNTLSQLGLSVPQDVMLAGFDDLKCAVTATPPLTTIHQPCEDISRVAYSALRERMRNPLQPSRKILLPAPLVVRESTARTGRGRRPA